MGKYYIIKKRITFNYHQPKTFQSVSLNIQPSKPSLYNSLIVKYLSGISKFSIEFLDNSGGMGRVVTPFAKNLEKLGMQVNYKVIDFALLQKRMDVFDFDVISNRTVGSEAPGTELLERFGSRSADVEGSGNVMGLKSPAVDVLLDKAVSANTRPQLIAALKALDRVLRHGHYVVPHWYGAVHRVAWRAAKFERPAVTPRYYQPDNWVTQVWWSRNPTTSSVKAN